MEHMICNNCYNEDDDDALSLKDLQMYDQTATSSIHSSPRKSSFEFFPTLFPSEQHGEEQLIQAGSLIPSLVNEELNNRSSSLRLLPEQEIKKVIPLGSVSNRDFGSSRRSGKLSKSKRMRFMCGPVMVMPDLEMKSIRERQGRLAPSRMFSVTEKVAAVTDTNKNTVKMENPVVNQLPEAASLPDGFVDSSSADPLTRCSSARGRESRVLDYKEESCVYVAAAERGVERLADCVHRMVVSEGDGISGKDTKRKSGKRAFKTVQEFLEFTLSYQKVISERDAAISMRDKLESLCRELQHQNKMLMDECKRVSTESQNLRLELSDKFQKAIKDVTNKLEEQRDDSLTQLKENEMLRNQLKQKEGQIVLAEQQHAHQLKQKSLELQIADLKIQQHEENLVKEQSQMKMYAEQVSELLATEKNLRSQLTADGEKFQQFQDALVKSNEVFESFKQEMGKMTKSITDLKKENTFLKSKTEKSDYTLVQLVEEREHMKKQLEKTKNQKEKLKSLCRSLQAERKQNQSGQNNADSLPV
ncbi:uncharacterized protein LOC143548536 [Bidens hawaiensis]|uniref:uncharacterized protein LOC143548536 n=1 Tax=Bidens hawaiensis TaxID=980011 RepID=UPI00404A5315